MEFNVNSADCIKHYSKMGETVYKNICTGEEDVVPWGVETYFAGTVLVTIVAVFIVAMIMLFKDL